MAKVQRIDPTIQWKENRRRKNVEQENSDRRPAASRACSYFTPLEPLSPPAPPRFKTCLTAYSTHKLASSVELGQIASRRPLVRNDKSRETFLVM